MNTVRALTPVEMQAYRAARLRAVETTPYFARALFCLNPVAEEGLGTLAVAKDWRCFIDPALLVGDQAWPVATVAGGLVHEAQHVLREHHDRAKLVPDLQHEDWNIAADCEINDDLATTVALPDGVALPSVFGLVDGQTAEQYYAQIKGKVPPDPDAGYTGCGSGSGSPATPGELAAAQSPDGVDLPEGLSPAQARAMRRVVADDVTAHCAKNPGTTPQGVSRWAEDTLAPAKIPWQRTLRAGIRRVVADASGQVDYTYRKINRRTAPGGILRPSLRAPRLNVSIVVDTSGSMSPADLSAALSEVSGVLTARGINRHNTRILTCDAATSTPRRIRSIKDIELIGGGGTDMRVGIDAALTVKPKPSIVIVLTDGFTPWPAKPIGARLICALVGSQPPADSTPTWATTVTID